MGRNRYKFFEPPVLPPGYVSPRGAIKWEKPPDPTEVDTTVDVDKAKSRVKKTDNAAPAATDHFIGVDTTTKEVTITLPSTATVAEGKIFLIKDEGGNAGTNNIVIATTGATTIDGNSLVKITSDYGALNIYYNGTEWSIY
jgi:hypothetical protein